MGFYFLCSFDSNGWWLLCHLSACFCTHYFVALWIDVLLQVVINTAIPGDGTTNFSFCSSLNMLVFRSQLSLEPDIMLFAIPHSYNQKPVLITIKLQFWGINLIFISLCFIQLREWMEWWETRHYYRWRFQQCLFR